MGKYYSCNNCGNVEEGNSIYKCQHCGAIFCDSCGIEYSQFVLLALETRYWLACPECDESDWMELGEIISADND